MPPDKALVPKCTKATLVWSEQAPGTGTLQEMPLASTLQPTTLTSPAPPGMASAHCTRSPSSARRRPCLSIWFPHPNTSSLILYILSSLNGFSAFKKLSEKHRHSLEVKSQTSASHRIYDTLNLQLAQLLLHDLRFSDTEQCKGIVICQEVPSNWCPGFCGAED